MTSTRTTTIWRREELILDVYSVALGLFLFVAPWLFAYSSGVGKAEAWAGGLAVAAVSLAAVVAFAEWEEWLRLLLGIWLIAAPWVLGFPHTTGMHLSIGVGIIATYLTLLELWLMHYRADWKPQPKETS